MRTFRAFCLPLLIAASIHACAGASDSTRPPQDTRGLRVVAGAGQTDVVLTKLSQALVVEVRDSTGRVVEGLTVRFVSVRDSGGPYVQSVPPNQLSAFDSASVVTDSSGRAQVSVMTGRVAGTARLEVSVPELALADTVTYTVQPARPSQFTLSPRDTTITLGKSFTLTAVPTDAYGNVISGATTTFTAGAGVTASTAGTVVAQSTFTRTRVVVSYQGVSDTAWVSVVPLFPLVTGGSVQLINTDGSGRTRLALFDEWLTSPSSVAATPSVVFQRQGFNNVGLGVVEPNGTPRPLLGAWSADDNWPRLSPDGAWVYFVRYGETLWRVKLDGTGLDSLTSFVSTARYRAPTISPDGKSVAIEDGTGVQIVDVGTKAKRTVPVTCPAPRYSPDGTQFACLTLTTVSVMGIDGTGQRVVARFNAPGTDDVTGVDWSPDGNWLLVETANVLGNAVLIDVSTGKRLPLKAVGPQASFVR